MTKPRGGTLLVASTGGHLQELYHLKERFSPVADPIQWVTFDEPQSRSLLRSETVHHVAYVKPRGYVAAMSNLAAAVKILRRGRYRRVISTGSGIAIPFIVAGRMLGVPCHYIESAARSEGPSLTGRVVSKVPGTHLYTQYRSCATGNWGYRGSLFDRYTANDLVRETAQVSRVVVTLGTMRVYGFRRAVDAVCSVIDPLLAPDAEILWQVGSTEVSDLPFKTHEMIPAERMQQAIAAADLVIAHAGIGSALTALDAGKCPVLLPRLAAHTEHVDDHQLLISTELDARGLAVSCDPQALTTEHLIRASTTAVTSDRQSDSFALD